MNMLPARAFVKTFLVITIKKYRMKLK